MLFAGPVMLCFVVNVNAIISRLIIKINFFYYIRMGVFSKRKCSHLNFFATEKRNRQNESCSPNGNKMENTQPEVTIPTNGRHSLENNPIIEDKDYNKKSKVRDSEDSKLFGSRNTDDQEDEEENSENCLTADEHEDTKNSSTQFKIHESQSLSELQGSNISSTKKRKIVKPLTAAALAAFEKAQDRTGLVYLSRIPPFMKPTKIRHLLSKYGEIGRVYLAAEDPKTRARRVKYGGNKKHNFTEGWVEFLDKKVAKRTAALLNGETMGGKKGNHYYGDLWNIKYLPGFRWTHLTERIAYEKAERQQRMRAELAQATKETKTYIHNVEKAKMIQNMEEKKRKRSEEQKESHSAADGDHDSKPNQNSAITKEEIRRRFRQRKLMTKEINFQTGNEKITPVVIPDGKVKTVVSKVFGGI